MPENLTGRVTIRDADNNITLALDGEEGVIYLGGNPRDGKLSIIGDNGREITQVAATGEIFVGNNGRDGFVHVRNDAGRIRASLWGKGGELRLRNNSEEVTIALNGEDGIMYLGGHGRSGILSVVDRHGRETISIQAQDGYIAVGNNGRDGVIDVRNGAGNPMISLNGNSGDISLQGEIRIKDWSISTPDYVFAENYQLRQLSDLEHYISVHGHLPEVPSADEFGREGVNIGALCMLLLKKVEEMTLYLLQQERTILEQRARLSKLEQQQVAS